jgi:hypothetical protein
MVRTVNSPVAAAATIAATHALWAPVDKPDGRWSSGGPATAGSSAFLEEHPPGRIVAAIADRAARIAR